MIDKYGAGDGTRTRLYLCVAMHTYRKLLKTIRSLWPLLQSMPACFCGMTANDSAEAENGTRKVMYNRSLSFEQFARP
jgi:hypothetical protein